MWLKSACHAVCVCVCVCVCVMPVSSYVGEVGERTFVSPCRLFKVPVCVCVCVVCVCVRLLSESTMLRRYHDNMAIDAAPISLQAASASAAASHRLASRESVDVTANTGCVGLGDTPSLFTLAQQVNVGTELGNFSLPMWRYALMATCAEGVVKETQQARQERAHTWLIEYVCLGARL